MNTLKPLKPKKSKYKPKDHDHVNFQFNLDANGIVPHSSEEYYAKIDSWSWSSHLASVLCGTRPLRCTFANLFERYGFFRKGLVDSQRFFNFCDSIELKYQKVISLTLFFVHPFFSIGISIIMVSTVPTFSRRYM